MSKILNALAMLLVIAAIVFASGCANQSTNTQNASTAVTPTETPATEVTTAETPSENVTETPTENVTEAPTENMTATPTENVTANTPVPTVATNGTNLNSVQRHQLVAQQQAQQQQSNSTLAVTPNNY